MHPSVPQQTAIFRNGKNGNIVAVLISGEKPCPGRINRKITRCFSAAGDALQQTKRAVRQNAEAAQTVMPAIGGVEITAVGRQMQIRTDVAGAIEVCRKRRNRL